MRKDKPQVALASLAAVILLASAAPAACDESPSPRDILTRSLSLHDDIKDYTCRMTVEMHFPNVRVPKRTFTVYVKRPDKVRVDSHGQLVIVPKDVLLLGSLKGKIGSQARVVLMSKTQVGRRPLYALKVIPEDRRRHERLLLWVWGDTWTFKRTQIVRGANPIMTVDWQHVRVGKYWMPSKVVCQLSGGELAQEGEGRIIIQFSDWRVNVGLPDELFIKSEGRRSGERKR